MSDRSPILRVVRQFNDRLRAIRDLMTRRTTNVDVSGFPSQIAACRASLERFGQASDGEFTALARGLSQLNGRLAGLRARNEAMAAVLGDRDEDRAVAAAYSLHKDSVELVHANAGIAVAAYTQLMGVEAALLESCRSRDAFERDHLQLHIITVGIRMEASRLSPEDQAVFLNVAAAISETGNRIRACTDAAFTRIEAVIVESREARAELRASEKALHLRARASIGRIESELGALRKALAPCAERSREISDLLATAQPQVLAIIGGLQHQDIVRQQLEHVGEGFHDIAVHLGVEASDAVPSTFPAPEWDYLQPAVRIQSAQLEASRAEIEHAGEVVISGLESLLATSTTLVERFSSMDEAVTAALGECRMSELFFQELQELARTIEQSQRANGRTAQLIERIEDVVRVFSEEIRRYELDVKIVALNAQIASAQLQSARGLDRLGEETCEVSARNAHLTSQLSIQLRSNLDKLDAVKRQGAEFLAVMSEEKGKLERGLGSVCEKLNRFVSEVRESATRARKEFEPIHENCAVLLDGLGFPALIESTFTPAAGLCRALAEAGATSQGDVEPTDSARSKIESHRRRYTMQKENSTHAAALGIVAVASAAAGDGDGVELFGGPDGGTAEPIRGLPAPAVDNAEVGARGSESSGAAFGTSGIGGVSDLPPPPPTVPGEPGEPGKNFGEGIDLF